MNKRRCTWYYDGHMWCHLWLVSSSANWKNTCWLWPHADLGFGGTISTFCLIHSGTAQEAPCFQRSQFTGCSSSHQESQVYAEAVLSEKPKTWDYTRRRFPLLSLICIIPLYLQNVRLSVLTTISSTPQITSNVQSLRSIWSLSDALLARGTSLSELKSLPLLTVPTPIQQGMFRCTSRYVTCQEHVLESDFLKSHSTGAHHQITDHITCNTSNFM